MELLNMKNQHEAQVFVALKDSIKKAEKRKAGKIKKKACTQLDTGMG